LECELFFDKAVHYWLAKNNKKKSLFYLGAAAHLVQDLCVPHHARGIAFNGHNEYEKWVQENSQSYMVYSKGKYINATSAGDWITHNAKISRIYFPYISGIYSISSYKMVTGILLPLSQRTTAGFFSYFLDTVLSKEHEMKLK